MTKQEFIHKVVESNPTACLFRSEHDNFMIVDLQGGYGLRTILGGGDGFDMTVSQFDELSNLIKLVFNSEIPF